MAATPNPEQPIVLLVHGMWHGRWCWDRWKALFEAAGFRVESVELTGHGAQFTSTGAVRWLGLQTYVDDVIRAAKALPRAPILVGHSLGCLLVELCLEDIRPPAVALLAPTRHGIFARSVGRFARAHPLRFLQLNVCASMKPPVATPALARELLFSREMADSEVEALHARLHDESYWVALQLLFGLGPKPVRPPAYRGPMLVAGGSADHAVLPSDLKEVAGDYKAALEEFPGLPHDLMLAPGGDGAGRFVAAWLANAIRA